MGKNWSRRGTVYSELTPKEKVEKSLTVEEQIIRDLKSEPFKRGYTYKALSEKYNVSQHKVLTLRKENNI